MRKCIAGKTAKRLICLLLALAVAAALAPAATAKSTERYPAVFVAGYGGYGDYDKINAFFPYWGMASGDLLAYLREQGFECYAASVDPVDSAWDRACELYAQLTGTLTDYGAVHAAHNGHARYGADFTGRALVDGWGTPGGNAEKINFVCHSFGGTTVRLMAQLLVDGCPEEVSGTEPGTVSGLFTGGKIGLIESISTFATPHNGTTVLDAAYLVRSLLPDGSKKIVGIRNPTGLGAIDYAINMSRLLTNGLGPDTGIYDLMPDGAAKINENLSAQPDIYYFSYPTDCTQPLQLFGTRFPVGALTEPVFWPFAVYMGFATGTTPGGIAYGSEWFGSDGIVNTVSSRAPFDDPQQPFDPEDIEPGVWNIMDTFPGDHASIIGGFMRAGDVRAFYAAHMAMVDAL